MALRAIVFIVVLIFILLSRFSTTQSQVAPHVLGVEELVALATQRNGDLLALKQRLTEAEGRIREAHLRPVHTIEIEGSTGRLLRTVGEEEFAAAYSVPFETFGKRDKRVRIAQEANDLAQFGIAEAIRGLSFEVTARYVDAIAAREKVKAVEQLLAVNREHYSLLEVRVARGDAPPLELQLFAAELKRAEAQQALVAGRWVAALAGLKRWVGFDPAESLVLSEQSVIRAVRPYSLAELLGRALQKRPDLQEMRVLEEQATAQVSLAQVETRPDLTLFIRYARRNSRFEDAFGSNAAGIPLPLRDRDNVVSFGLSLPLSSSGRSQGGVQVAVSRLEAARLRRQYLQTAIPSQVEAAFSSWSGSKKAAELLGQAVGQSESNLQVVRAAYNLGQLRLFDVLSEQRRLIESQLGYIDAQAEQSKSLAELEQAVGGAIQ